MNLPKYEDIASALAATTIDATYYGRGFMSISADGEVNHLSIDEVVVFVEELKPHLPMYMKQRIKDQRSLLNEIKKDVKNEIKTFGTSIINRIIELRNKGRDGG